MMARRMDVLNAQQKRAAEILATNDYHQLSMGQVAEEVGISQATLYRWKNDKHFIRYQNEVAERWMEQFLAETYVHLKGMVRTGRSESAKVKAIELVLKNRGKLTDVQKVEATVEDRRSNAAIAEEIEELKKQLEE
ncbi:hypothetical protein Dtox_3917 [Desulfofarcimen acetoxidans DSM 771]|uniref:Homeodomain phBC6A51-type domain-containing protein n=1 Tax=Desulfofarcimen acetoxidans (strain ATCC 49208 / DSM 771 / KCTC 5769 / VKM B-1644 / 5575) TaxID=485916 RepID=C8VXY1_DESAS|nr:phBC6A51 family helix-turn-helix protein [Desulfofarcimen acetoxidans]ACV64610.1 hypothetical protein Dtox_3917 [Desulfofarcimen acetoxidans DSM 771]